MSVLADETEEMVLTTFARFFEDFESKVDHHGGDDGAEISSMWEEFSALGGHRVARGLEGTLGEGFVLSSMVARAAGRGLACIPYAEHVHAMSLFVALGLDDLDFADDGTCWTVVTRDGSGRGPSLVAGGAVAAGVIVLDGTHVEIHDIGPVARPAVPNLGTLPFARIDLDALTAVGTGDLDDARVRRAATDKAVVDAAWLVGAAERALDTVLEHVRERRQFDRPIGSFQALQHRLADCAAQLEGASLLTQRVARLEEDDERRRRLASSAVLYAATTAEVIARETVQMFGGYGVCEEYAAPRLLRRIKSRKALALEGRAPDDCLPRALEARP